MKIGIVGYGVYIPHYRIKVEEIARVWGKNPEAIKDGLLIEEKAVPGPDEDTITISVEAARYAVARAGIDPTEIGAIYVGSESHPYSVKPSATTVAEAIGATPALTAADYEFACKAGTAAIQTCMGLVGAKLVKYGVAIGADVSQGAPGDELEYTTAAGGAAYIIGAGDSLIANFEGFFSFTTDTPDFWRRDGQPYPRHGGRFTGKPAYFKHTISAAKGLMEKLGTTPKDYNYIVLHQPNGKFPIRAASELGFNMDQIKTGLLCPKIGNTYSGSSLIGFANVLDKAKPGEKILLVSFGSGAGSDAFSVVVDDSIDQKRNKAPLVSHFLNPCVYIDYAIYAKYKQKFKVATLP
ncbi:MAG: hydroxymethylglutaryl-CoA synthase [Euryarchaeota archaeon]|nr:hydroxymethylglutaryl-CoA synthase [Euryarchaeota archaeon]